MICKKCTLSEQEETLLPGSVVWGLLGLADDIEEAAIKENVPIRQ